MDKQFPTEEEMHEMKAPWPETPEELVAFITTITDRPHDYGTCVSAMSLAAEAAFNYVASVLAVTGFQASCADLDFLRRTRRIKGPFALIEGEDMMYPQYDIFNKTIQTINNWRPWAAKEAQKRIDELSGENKLRKIKWEDDSEVEMPDVHPEVWEHWQRLAAFQQQDENKPDFNK